MVSCVAWAWAYEQGEQYWDLQYKEEEIVRHSWLYFLGDIIARKLTKELALLPVTTCRTITRDARIALVGRASSQWSFQCAPPSLMII